MFIDVKRIYFGFYLNSNRFTDNVRPLCKWRHLWFNIFVQIMIVKELNGFHSKTNRFVSGLLWTVQESGANFSLTSKPTSTVIYSRLIKFSSIIIKFKASRIRDESS